jgi:hypothetical protein
LKVWIVFQEQNEAPGDEYLLEWKDVIKVVGSQEKAEKECEERWDYTFESYEVE